MPHNYGSRLILSACVVLFCLFGIPGIGGGIVRTGAMFSDIPTSQKFNLKPGIDIAGGTSLTYEIEMPAGTDRDKKVEELAGGSKERLEQYTKLAKLHDEVVKQNEAVAAAQKAKDTPALNKAADAAARAEIEYDKAQEGLGTSNIP